MVTPTHLADIRQMLPATTTQIYLNNGTFGPLSDDVTRAMQTRVQEEWQYGRLGTTAGFASMLAIASQTRQQLASLLHAQEEEIALTVSTTHGLNIVSNGIDWQAGDEVIITNHEHIGAFAPLYQLRDHKGISIKIADLGNQANHPLCPTIEALLTSRTRLIVLSHVTWTTGTVLDIQSIGKLGQAYHVPVLVDGAQAAGAIPVNVHELDIDFYSVPMQKWLCGPDGAGALYVRQASLSMITPTFVGFPSAVFGEAWRLQDDAKRFEFGGLPTSTIVGQYAALQWLENKVTYDWMFQHISELNTYAYHAIKTISGINVLTPQPGDSGILAFRLMDQNVEEIVKRLGLEYAIYIRSIPETKALRICTGFYNTEEEIDKLVHALITITASS